nr:DNA-processing protein DprA [uncultured Sharpea sp.]
MEEVLLYFALKYRGDFHAIMQAVQNKEEVNQDEAMALKAKLHSNYVTILSPHYPSALKNIQCPPFVLFYYGHIMAIGIDGASHRAAMRYHGHTVAVLGGGIDYIYPKSNTDIYDVMKHEHLIISEIPFDQMPRRIDFPKRNRIIAGLSSSLLVVEAQEKSGTMITVGCALEQGKDVFAIPGRIYDHGGCNKLIDQGAKLVMKVEDIIEELY